MMTIDEAIALVRIENECIKRAENCNRKCNECDLVQNTDTLLDLYGKLAEWLEKLKYIENIILKWNADLYNDEDTGIPDNEILEAIFNACTDNGFDIPIDEDYRKGYNKAVDDFIHECDIFCGYYKGECKNLTRENILKIERQLKEGVADAGSI